MITIIIPVFNAERYIGPCLDALQKLDYPTDLIEIIVMDNGSRDRTVDIVKGYGVRLFILPQVTISQLRNTGAQHARGEYLAFIDADCLAGEAWLKLSTQILKDSAIGAAGCWYRLSPKSVFLEKVWNAHMGARSATIGDIDWVPSGNLIMPKSVFDKIGGFDESLTTAEDVDICRRIHHAGLSVFSHPALAVVHLGESKNLKQFVLKEKWRGEGVLQNLVREFPHIHLNKAILFTFITLLALIAILVSVGQHNRSALLLSVILLLAAPCYLTLKACFSSRQWQYCLPLIFLFVVYGVARILSAFSPRVWKI